MYQIIKNFVPVLSVCDVNISEIDDQRMKKCNVVIKKKILNRRLSFKR